MVVCAGKDTSSVICATRDRVSAGISANRLTDLSRIVVSSVEYIVRTSLSFANRLTGTTPLNRALPRAMRETNSQANGDTGTFCQSIVSGPDLSVERNRKSSAIADSQSLAE